MGLLEVWVSVGVSESRPTGYLGVRPLFTYAFRAGFPSFLRKKGGSLPRSLGYLGVRPLFTCPFSGPGSPLFCVKRGVSCLDFGGMLA